jgi:Domain of unknown function (DUF4381)
MSARIAPLLALLGLLVLAPALLPSAAIADTAADTAAASVAEPATGPGASSAAADSAADDDIRDIRGPKYIFPLWLAIAWAAGAALLAAGGYAWWRWRQRRRAARQLELFEIALQRLDEARSLMHPSSVEQYSVAISDIVRQYIEAAMHVTATHRTTEEFLRDLLDSSNASLATHRNLLAEFLSQCDMAKFAGVGLSMQIMESLHRSARSFVIETSKPVPATAAAA